jgi:putative heme-binding domain-containing protein
MTALGAIGDETAVKALLGTVQSDSIKAFPETLIAGLTALGKAQAQEPVKTALSQIAGLMTNSNKQVRSAVVALLAEHPQAEVTRNILRKSMDDKDNDVVKSAMAAIAKIKDKESIPALLKRAGDNSTRFEAMTALAEMPDPRSARIYLAGLTEKSPQLRKASSAALAQIQKEAIPVLELLASRKELPSTALTELRKIYNRPIPIKKWQLIGPFAKGDNAEVDPLATIDFKQPMVGRKGMKVQWMEQTTDHLAGMVDLAKPYGGETDQFAFGVANLTSGEARKAQMVVGSDDSLTVWLNGVKVYSFKDSRGYQADSSSVEISLKAGENRFIIKCGNNGGPWQFSVGVNEIGDYAFLKGAAPGQFDAEEFRKKAVEEAGDAVRGQKLFADVKGLACVKCHAVGGQGGAVGPELSGLAAKYNKDEIATSILYPSAKIASGYESLIVATKDGRVVTGVLKADTTSGLELEDADAKRVRVELEDIEERRAGDVSIMPNGLAEGLQPKDFADLLAYLDTLRETAKPASNPPANK